jgi:predicted RND superfamily exporter protein
MVKALDLYGEFLGRRPGLVLLTCVLIFIIGTIGSGLVTQTVIDFSEQVPSDLETIQSFEFIEDEFGSTGLNVIFAVEVDPDLPGSAEVRDVRDPEIMEYLDLLAQKSLTLEQVTRASSPADLLKQSNGGRIPQSSERIKQIIDSGLQVPGDSQSLDPLDFLVQTQFQLESLEEGLLVQQDLISQLGSGLQGLGPSGAELNASAAILEESNQGILAGVSALKAGIEQSSEFVEQFGASEDQAPARLEPPSPYKVFISDDFTVAAVRVTYLAVDDFESEDVIDELLQIADETTPPKGAKTTLTGGPVTNVVLFRQIGPTFALTGMLSFVAIFIVVVLIFYSLRYGVTSLLAVVFGSTWAFGLLGFTGFALNPNTSGALSLILGIGIDFGIQVVTRFRQELREMDARKAIAKTMPRVILPMTISMIAIILGFKALSLGNLQFVAELGDIMSLGVFTSYLAAITVIPAVLVFLNTFSLKSLRRGN